MILSNIKPTQITKWRINRGWEISYVAEQVGRSYGWLWQIENSDKNVPLYVVLLLSGLDKGIKPAL